MCIYICIYIYIHISSNQPTGSEVIPPKTSISPENPWLEDQISSEMLLFGGAWQTQSQGIQKPPRVLTRPPASSSSSSRAKME